METMPDLLSIQNLKKYYDGHKAVDDISFQLHSGSIFGLLGPNGAGKTTLIRMITGIIYPDSGEIQLQGRAFNGLKDNHYIGYMPEERGLYKKMKVGDHLLYLARLKDLSKSEARKKIHFWLQKFNLSEWWDKKIGDLSKGMQQKVQFIATILHEPKLLILDEPFSGLDPINTDTIKQEIYKLCQKGTTVIFSTHRMEQVEEICEHIVLVNNGKKLIDGSVSAIKDEFKKNEFNIHLGESIKEEDISSPLFEIIMVKENKVTLRLREDAGNNDILSYFIQKGYHVHAFNEMLPSINDVFIEIVQNRKRS